MCKVQTQMLVRPCSNTPSRLSDLVLLYKTQGPKESYTWLIWLF